MYSSASTGAEAGVAAAVDEGAVFADEVWEVGDEAHPQATNATKRAQRRMGVEYKVGDQRMTHAI